MHLAADHKMQVDNFKGALDLENFIIIIQKKFVEYEQHPVAKGAIPLVRTWQQTAKQVANFKGALDLENFIIIVQEKFVEHVYQTD